MLSIGSSQVKTELVHVTLFVTISEKANPPEMIKPRHNLLNHMLLSDKIQNCKHQATFNYIILQPSLLF